jgi:hypothetical protein
MDLLKLLCVTNKHIDMQVPPEHGYWGAEDLHHPAGRQVGQQGGAGGHHQPGSPAQMTGELWQISRNNGEGFHQFPIIKTLLPYIVCILARVCGCSLV